MATKAQTATPPAPPSPWIMPSFAPAQIPGAPNSPQFNPIYDPNTMALLPGMQSQLDGIDLTGLKSSVGAFRDQALRKGPSAWALMAGNQQDALASNSRERGAAENNAQTAGAMDRLAMSGGLTSGARERAVEEGGKNFMNMSQDTARQDTLNKLQIGVNDEQNKIQEMGMLPGMEASALNPDFQKANMWNTAHQADVSNAMGENQAANSFNQNLYHEQMAALGAQKQADATAKSGKK